MTPLAAWLLLGFALLVIALSMYLNDRKTLRDKPQPPDWDYDPEPACNADPDLLAIAKATGVYKNNHHPDYMLICNLDETGMEEAA